MHQFNLKGSDIEYKTVGRGNASSSRVNLPKSWEGNKVAIILLEESVSDQKSPTPDAANALSEA